MENGEELSATAITDWANALFDRVDRHRDMGEGAYVSNSRCILRRYVIDRLPTLPGELNDCTLLPPCNVSPLGSNMSRM